MELRKHQTQLLAVVQRHPGWVTSQIAAAMGISSNNLTALVDRLRVLEKLGVVRSEEFYHMSGTLCFRKWWPVPNLPDDQREPEEGGGE